MSSKSNNENSKKKKSIYLNSPICSKFIEEYKDSNYHLLTCTQQGYRKSLEDIYVYSLHLSNHSSYSCFGIFDGHSGKEAAKYLKNNLINKLNSFDNIEDNQSIVNGILELDKDYCTKYNNTRSGSTICFVLINHLPNNEKGYKVRVFWCGDSRCIWIDRKDLHNRNIVNFNGLTRDHKPTLPNEVIRIENANGYIVNNRVDGSLAMTRAFGDYNHKDQKDLPWTEQKVIAKCDYSEISVKYNDYLFLFSDGLCEKWNNNDICKHLYYYINQYELSNLDSKNILRNLFDDILLLSQTSDNMTCLLIKLLNPNDNNNNNSSSNILYNHVYFPGPLYYYENDKYFVKKYFENGKLFGYNNKNEIRRLGYNEDIKWIKERYDMKNDKDKEKYINEIQSAMDRIDSINDDRNNNSSNELSSNESNIGDDNATHLTGAFSPIIT